MTKRPLIDEWHTTDLLSRCAKRTQLRHEGKCVPEVTSAMLRGQLAHAHLSAWHLGQSVDLDEFIQGVKDEGKEVSAAAWRDIEDMHNEAKTLTSFYAIRFGDFFKRSKLIGVEVPVRWETTIDKKPVKFASHLDLVFRDPSDALCVWDWKTGDTDWDNDYAARSMQVGMYYMAVQYGFVCVQDDWFDLAEAPHVSIVNIEALKPYSRKTIARDDNGEEREFVKGDDRPMRAVSFEIFVNNEQAVIDEFATRVRMDRLGLWPMNPTDTGCRVCECRRHCATWQGQQTQVEVTDAAF